MRTTLKPPDAAPPAVQWYCIPDGLGGSGLLELASRPRAF